MDDGIDCYADCSTLGPAIKAASLSFVGRYYRSKKSSLVPLTAVEARALSQAGLNIVALWEYASNTADYFSYGAGLADGASAYQQALVAGQPPRTPIYFAVDFDASDAAIAGCINDYFRGVAAAYAAAGGGNVAYDIGVYGSGSTCTWLLNHGRATWTWLAMSTGWAGYATFNAWNIKQGPQNPSLTFDQDSDTAKTPYGAFQVR